jgi:peptide/nickel transport system ATP-binding protein
MYAGRKVEEAPVGALFADPKHPYMRGLLASIPRVGSARGLAPDLLRSLAGERLQEIPGIVPPLNELPPGCAFAPRCELADERCRQVAPRFEPKAAEHSAACWKS